TEAERNAALLAESRARIAEGESQSAEDARRLEVLNQQVAEMRKQMAALSAVNGEAEDRDAAALERVESLGRDLNAALARAALAEQKLRVQEEAENRRLAEENRNLARYRSEFFGKLHDVLSGREGVRVVGDRFVFSSEVLFEVGSATLS